MSFAVGSLVRARGREWVVLPDSGTDPDVLMLRPLGGSDDEIAGIYVGPGPDGRPFEEVRPAEFPLPDPERDTGSHLTARLLRDAVRLGFRSAAGPFRSLGRIAVEPRPYQFVPLLMALKLDPVRLLIADDVGIGKTVEACLIARELYDRAEIRRFAVLCPPHLAEQWQRALRDQFHIDAELVLAGTAARLERSLRTDESLFDRHAFTVVSTDYIKQKHRRYEFLRTCPELVIVDEAHGCADPGVRGAGQQRHEMLREIAKDDRRHLVLVTATPHSGNPLAFRSLLALLDPDLGNIPDDLSGDHNRKHRERLAMHLVQRRRGDVTSYLQSDTPFPKREVGESYYSLSPEYRSLFDRVLAFCRETYFDPSLDERRQRVRWWSALALLRSLSSSPDAAIATLKARARNANAETVDAVDEEGRRAVLDLDEQSTESLDVTPGSIVDEDGANDEASAHRRRLLDFAHEIEALGSESDAKLKKAVELTKKLVQDGSAPIIFCRFIPTVAYVAAALRRKLGRGVTVEAIDGSLPADEREARVIELAKAPSRVLVCTDCLSEGINLQEPFDAVVHYDLAWNPTRHEQREGRVDRYKQPRETVRALTYFGKDNPVDGIVLEVLLRKHQRIQGQLGVSVPVPTDSRVVERAILEGLMLRDTRASGQLALDFLEPIKHDMEVEWDAAVEREKKSRALFAQHPLQRAVHEQLAAELAEVRRALGDDAVVEQFARTSLGMLGARLTGERPVVANVRDCSAALRDAIGIDEQAALAFREPVPSGATLLVRTHPVIEGLAQYVFEGALDPDASGPARRAGAIRTSAVRTRTTLLLVRLRCHLVAVGIGGEERALLAEDQLLAAFTGSPQGAVWLSPEEAESLLALTPSSNLDDAARKQAVGRIVEGFPSIAGHLGTLARERGQKLLEAHQRVRQAARGGSRTVRVEVHEPPDVLGLYVFLPDTGAA